MTISYRFQRLRGFPVSMIAAVSMLAACSPEGEDGAAATAAASAETNGAPVDAGPAQQEVLDSLVGSQWRLIEIAGTEVAEDSNADLAFYEPGRLGGNGSVNRFNGGISVRDGALEVTPLASTMMAGPPDAMEREQHYLAALQAAASLAVSGDDELTITLRDREHPLRFKRISQPEP